MAYKLASYFWKTCKKCGGHFKTHQINEEFCYGCSTNLLEKLKDMIK